MCALRKSVITCVRIQNNQGHKSTNSSSPECNLLLGSWVERKKKKKQICFYDMHYFLNKIQEIRQSYVPKIQVVTPES